MGFNERLPMKLKSMSSRRVQEPWMVKVYTSAQISSYYKILHSIINLSTVTSFCRLKHFLIFLANLKWIGPEHLPCMEFSN